VNVLLRIVICLAVLAAPAGYFAYASGKSAVVAEMIDASRRDDAEAFSKRIAWEDLREYLIADITGQKKAMGTLGAGIGPNEKNIPPVVNHYVQAANIPLLFYYHAALFEGVKEEDFIDKTGFAPPFGFFVVVGYPKNVPVRHDMAAALRDRLKVKAVFRLDGFTWKLREMHVPLFMVPEQAHALPDVETLKR